MSDQPRPSHELFHDVTDTRPRAGRATGGTLAVSIVAHALILAAVIVVPLLATDTLPKLVDTVGVFSACRAAATRSATRRSSTAHRTTAKPTRGTSRPSSLRTRSSTSSRSRRPSSVRAVSSIRTR